MIPIFAISAAPVGNSVLKYAPTLYLDFTAAPTDTWQSAYGYGFYMVEV